MNDEMADGLMMAAPLASGKPVREGRSDSREADSSQADGEQGFHILLCGARGAVSEWLADALRRYGHSVTRRVEPGNPAEEADIVILYSRHFRTSDLLIVRKLADAAKAPGVIAFHEESDEADRILTLEMGADDCLSSGCGPRELHARIRALMRRRTSPRRCSPVVRASAHDDRRSIRFGNWVLDRLSRSVLRRGTDIPIPLRDSEFLVLEALAKQPRHVLSRRQLLKAANPAAEFTTGRGRAVDIHVSRLRKWLEPDGEEVIRTVRGRGYMLLPMTSQL